MSCGLVRLTQDRHRFDLPSDRVVLTLVKDKGMRMKAGCTIWPQPGRNRPKNPASYCRRFAVKPTRPATGFGQIGSSLPLPTCRRPVCR
ncbi:hypothetical protein SL003B_1182 [Polymorphum gilvum SL003B-26A1]|uniref:Uncharacterized protein n=1 Tax=Polymorphum gilvum (strain LMG 25793 / CGMCC 1.9160 / SL003B-26A1) TaxID=991905 RepID=F2IZQ4_POLGS|nr:hypothetical protein SL003B_1182 [Polymorphum gilvum SL003B-26A1]